MSCTRSYETFSGSDFMSWTTTTIFTVVDQKLDPSSTLISNLHLVKLEFRFLMIADEVHRSPKGTQHIFLNLLNP